MNGCEPINNITPLFIAASRYISQTTVDLSTIEILLNKANPLLDDFEKQSISAFEMILFRAISHLEKGKKIKENCCTQVLNLFKKKYPSQVEKHFSTYLKKIEERKQELQQNKTHIEYFLTNTENK